MHIYVNKLFFLFFHLKLLWKVSSMINALENLMFTVRIHESIINSSFPKCLMSFLNEKSLSVNHFSYLCEQYLILRGFSLNILWAKIKIYLETLKFFFSYIFDQFVYSKNVFFLLYLNFWDQCLLIKWIDKWL
jgi:hypothetical protein